MSKIKIHELAKELNTQSKDLVEFFGKKNIEVKNHMSSVEDSAADMARKSYTKAPESKVSNETSNDASKEVPKSAPKEEAPKKNIVHVFRPQNTQNAPKQGQRRQGTTSGTARPTHGKPIQANNGRPIKEEVKRPIGDRPSSERPQGDRTQATRPSGDRPQGNRPQSDRPQGNRPQSTRPQNDRQQGNRPQGNRPYNNRPQGDRTQDNRPYSDRPQGNRPQGDRPQGNRPQGDRPQGNRTQGNRPQGDRPQGNRNYGNRPQGDRPQGDRPYGNRPQGDRPYGDRNRQAGAGNRNGQGQNRPTDTSTAVVAKPSKGRNKGKDDFKKKTEHNNYHNNHGNKKGKLEQLTPLEKPKAKEQKVEEEIKSITIPEILTIKELAEKMKIVPSVIVKKLFLQGKVVTVNQEVDYATAEEIALEFDVLCEQEVKVDVIEELLKEDEEDESTMVKRPPVVSVMGHVDHGKTSLLDAIRNTNVIEKEAGGITQHIGAYMVNVNGEKITFLDTPGHEAFTAMRMRGANSTDIAILVVAADDGVMPQTVEAINHAKAAEIEIVVAINKMDKPGANIDKVKQELAEYELIPEDWGGSTIFVPVSAKTGEGIDTLMEMILLTAEVLELKANPNRKARGLVIEAELDKGKGSVATILVQKGTLHVGDHIAAGSAHGKVRAMMDDKGKRVKSAGPSTPVEILGLNGVPNAGEVFVCCDTDKEARSFAETFISQGKERLLDDTKSKVSLDDLFEQIKEGNLKELGIVIKADVQGSVEALKQSLLKISNDEVVVKIIHGGVGAINESDVILASASNAIVIGFNVRPDASAKETADREGVDIRLYRVIYSAIEDIESAMKGMLDPIFEEKVLGHAEVRQTFKASGVGTIAGSYVLDGTFERGCSVRITRDNDVIFDGLLASLKRFKDDVKEVKAGYECGLVFENFNDIKEEDKVEAYKMVEVPR
ncbi:MAG: translation initiation factor IF-2 [Suipraeoptans sp.]